MKKFVALVSSILLIGSTAVYAADVSKGSANVAVVNMQQVLQQSPKVSELSKKLQSQFKERQEKLDLAQKSLQEELDKFKKDSATMNPQNRDATQKKVADDRANLVKQVVAFQQDLNKKQGEAMQSIMGQMNEIISGMAKKNGYTLVLDSQAVVYSTEGTDITKEVAKLFEGKK